MSYLDTSKESFIGSSYGNKNQLLVLGKAEIKSRARLFLVECQICKKDPELHGAAIYKMKKQSIISGELSCGCSESTKWKEWQYIILVKRACIKKNLTFISFCGVFKGTKTKLELVCHEHGTWHSSTINSLIHSDRGCPQCGYQKTADNNRLSMCVINSNLDNLKNYTNAFVIGSYKDYTSLINVTCKSCGFKRNVRYQSLINGVGCPVCNKPKGRGYQKLKNGYNYICILKHRHTEYEFLGYGKTNNPKRRYREHVKSADIDGYDVIKWRCFQAHDAKEASMIEIAFKEAFPTIKNIEVDGFKVENTHAKYYDKICRWLINED